MTPGPSALTPPPSSASAAEPTPNDGPKHCVHCGATVEDAQLAQPPVASGGEPSPSARAFAPPPPVQAALGQEQQHAAAGELNALVCNECRARGSSSAAGAAAARQGEVASSSNVASGSSRLQDAEEEDVQMEDVSSASRTQQQQQQHDDVQGEAYAVPWRRSSAWEAQRQPSNLSSASGSGSAPSRSPPHTRDAEASNSTHAAASSSSSASAAVAGSSIAPPTTTEEEFPPLAFAARSASPTSPRARSEARFGAASPTRIASSSASAAATAGAGDASRERVRQSSFSRSTLTYNTTSGSGNAGVRNNSPFHDTTHSASTSSATLSSPHPGVPLPQVSFPRVPRASSSSTASLSPPSPFASAQRRPSSSSSSTTTQDPLGPHAMTRPRLSSLHSPPSSIPAVLLPLPTAAHYPTPPSTSPPGGATTQREWRLLATHPDPRTDISRLRSKSKGKGCLFPGATFVGTQKSGRSCYEVGVKIVNVDLEASHLCGYLNIRGLTEDWPELTTFFDAEIIGLRYSFVTGKWGAKESNDMTHWSRFAPFRPLRNRLGKTAHFNHLNRPYIFMRWKERFLVPDHRVRDINGASFAGFYYVCVELGDVPSPSAPTSSSTLVPSSSSTLSSSAPSSSFEAQRPHRRSLFTSSTLDGAGVGGSSGGSAGPAPLYPTPSLAATVSAATAAATAAVESASATAAAQAGDLEDVQMADSPSTTAAATGRGNEDSFGRSNFGGGNVTMPQAPSLSYTAAGGITAGRMTGFYFHENSEPYQQLSLHHVPESSSSTFEMR